jgi:hypothetical protein
MGGPVSLDEVLKLLFFVPLPLKRPMALGIVVMLALAAILALAQGFGYWDAVWDPIWLYALMVCCLWLAGLAIARRERLRAGLTLPWSAGFVIIALLAAVEGRAHNAYVYNELGFLQSRAWSRELEPSGAPALMSWKWNLIAVQDLGESPLLVELRETDGCHFETFWPTSESSQYTPPITDVSQGALARRWQIQNFRKPARLTFHLVTKREPRPPDKCQPQISIGGGK